MNIRTKGMIKILNSPDVSDDEFESLINIFSSQALYNSYIDGYQHYLIVGNQSYQRGMIHEKFSNNTVSQLCLHDRDWLKELDYIYKDKVE